MVLDINLFRSDKCGDPNLIKQNQEKRRKPVNLVENVILYDEQFRKVRYQLDCLNRTKNVCSKTVGLKMKNKEPDNQSDTQAYDLDFLVSSLSNEFAQTLSISQLKTATKSVDQHIKELGEQLNLIEEIRNKNLQEIGNLLHPSVPIGGEEAFETIRTFGDCQSTKKYSHVDLLVMVDGVDYERGTKIAGNRAYFLKGPLVFLEQALIQLSLDILHSKKYTLLTTPFFINKSIMHQVAQLSQFDEELYKVSTKSEIKGEESIEEKYLIATSEQPIAAFHSNEWLDPSTLPLKYAGYSSCFRQEVGSHGRDTTGIFRVHQFQKVEQFCLTAPENSWPMFDEMIGNAESLFQLLKIPYRIINIPSGDLNNAAAKKFDLEGWYPGCKSFKELVSCSNCTDYQSRRLAIRFGQSKKMNKDVEYVHMLNATMCATTRVICCLAENYQQEDGITIPECLHKYLPADMHFLKFIKPPPIEQLKK